MGLKVIACVGETLEQREAGETLSVLAEQVKAIAGITSGTHIHILNKFSSRDSDSGRRWEEMVKRTYDDVTYDDVTNDDITYDDITCCVKSGELPEYVIIVISTSYECSSVNTYDEMTFKHLFH